MWYISNKRGVIDMWIGDEYKYSKKVLKAIAEGYQIVYEGLALSWRSEIVNEWSIAEFKADFDMALDSIGRGHWSGNIEGKGFKDFRHFGRLQRIVIADIYGIEDRELEGLGFSQISRARGLAYKWMANHLNGIPFRGSQTRFVAKRLDKGVYNRG